MSLNLVTNRHKPRKWPQVVAALVVLSVIAGWIVYRAMGSPSTVEAAPAANAVPMPYSTSQLNDALLTPADAGTGFTEVAPAAQASGDVPTSTGCLQLDGVVEGMASPVQADAFRNLVYRAALPAVEEQINAESASDMTTDYAAAAAALGTCPRLVFDLAPGKRLDMTMSTASVDTGNVPVIARMLSGSLGPIPVHGFLGIARPTKSSALILLFLNSAAQSPAASLKQALWMFHRAIAKAERHLPADSASVSAAG